MYNDATDKALESMKSMDVTIGTGRAAEILGISPRCFKKYLENTNPLPDYAIEVTDDGERRTFRILTERFALFLSCGEPNIEIKGIEIEPGDPIGFLAGMN